MGRSTPVSARATAILDIDGTLVDSNYHHAIAWFRAFRRHGVILPLWRIHRRIGMGGDQLVPALAGDAFERERGDAVREGHDRSYAELIDEVAPLDGARDLILELQRRRWEVVLASSAAEDEVDRYLDLLEARDLVAGWTTSADVDSTKPEPDLVEAAMKITRGDGPAAMVGDTPWDVLAARRVGVPCLTVLTGGFSERELRDAGAAGVFESLPELIAGLDQSALGATLDKEGFSPLHSG